MTDTSLGVVAQRFVGEDPRNYYDNNLETPLLKSILVGISLTLALLMPAPLFRRIIKRHHTRDFSKSFAWMLVAIQVNQGFIAYITHSNFFIFWYILQTVITSTQLGLIYYYWNHDEPRYRQETQYPGRGTF